jgi:hypothetical protein
MAVPFASRLALLALLVALAAPGAAFAADGQIKLALTPDRQPGSFFDLTMRPGESRSLSVKIGNAGDAALLARTYAADVYTIINGGFGGRLRDQRQTGTTTWLEYGTEVLELRAGKTVDRSFTIAVPASTGPGEYITSLILENDRPIHSDTAVVLDQIVRQAVAVVITVPGPRSPGLVIGAATHEVVADRSVASIAVENTGNVRLKPVATFWLYDASGDLLNQAAIVMDTFYAHTTTAVEMPFGSLLEPGTYTMRLTLDDVAQGASADKTRIVLVVEPRADTAAGGGAVPDLTQVIQFGEGQVSLPLWTILLAAGLILGSALILLAVTLRRHRRTGTSDR